MFPRFVMIKQNYHADKIADIPEAVIKAVREMEYKLGSLKGKTVGIAVGSRGISNLETIVKTVVDLVKEHQGRPIIFAAMGSHGASTSSRQEEILHSLGITAESMGAEISWTTESVLYGTAKNGMEVYGAKTALAFDQMILINRIKCHTDFEDTTESGLCKLLAIGIGNHQGATHIHANALRLGYGPAIREAAALMLEKLPVIFGIAITENWKQETNGIHAVLPEKLVETEIALLEKVKDSSIKLPVADLDTLIIQEAGKNISGTCVDTKVVGRIMIPGQAEPAAPKIKTIAVLDFTEVSHGNAMGLGVVDIITKRAVAKIDIEATSITGMTSTCLLQAKIPCVAPNDLKAIEVSFTATGIEKTEALRAIYIKNTSSLEYMAVSEQVFDVIKDKANIEKISGPFELSFDEAGNLQTLF